MRDMTRDELQDRLPELLHGRLSAAEAAELERAVSADPELAEELTLLRTVRAAHRHAPAIDVSRIVAALPAPRVEPVVTHSVPVVDDLAARRNAKRPLISRQFARAAAVLVVVGGGTMVSVWERRGPAPTELAPVIRAETASVAGNSMQLGLGTSTDELTVDQLRALESDIRALDGVPSAEPEATTDLLPAEGA